MKIEFKDCYRVFWYITYTNHGQHEILVRNQEWGQRGSMMINIPYLKEDVYDNPDLSQHEIMMEIAKELSKMSLMFASGIRDAHIVDKFPFDKG